MRRLKLEPGCIAMRFRYCVLTIMTLTLLVSSSTAQKGEMMVRISEIEIVPASIEQYKNILKEEAAASVKLEPGVIAIFPMYQQADPTQVRILEIYANNKAYESHLKTPYFQRYKATTLSMVKSLKLVGMEAIDPEAMNFIFQKMEKGR